MFNFYKLQKLIENSNNISININDFKQKAYKKIKDFIEDYKDKTEKLSLLQPNINLIKNKLKDYPKINELVSALESSNKNLIKILVRDCYNYLMSLNFEDRYKVFDVYRHISDIEDKLSNRELNEEDQYKYAKEQVKKTYRNMSIVKDMIENALGRMEYNGSSITINPTYYPDNAEEFIPDSSAGDVVVGSNKNGLFSFILENNKLIIDDILEAEDDDFFSNDFEKQDYYNLISALQNPNEIKKEIIITLYTARPAKDREFYSNTNYLPANIFLSNSFSHVDGLAGDFGDDERRDIYKIRINSKYLVKTLDGPIKYYMVIKDAPVESIELY